MQKGRIIVLLLILVLIISGCGKENQSPVDTGRENLQTNRNLNQEEENTLISKEEESQEVINTNDKIEQEPMVFAPFLGKLVKNIQLPNPIMVMIENSPAARPQVGLEDASIVYEFLVEGGITRFLALFYETFPEKIGPVRSTRPYFIQTALEHDATLLHVGASAEGFHLLATSGISHIDQLSAGSYFWRDKKRRAPHNVYTGKSNIQSYLNTLSFRSVDPFFTYKSVSFINQQNIKESNEIKIRYWGGYTVGFKYDSTKGDYLRFIDGVPHLMEGGKKIYADNILIQYADTSVKDDEGRLEMNLTGLGKALFFKNGYVFEGKWLKNKGERCLFLGEDGDEWQLNPGQTWIEVVPLSTKIYY